jgi:hypothetical protein
MTTPDDLLHPIDERPDTTRDAELDQYVDAFRISSTRSRVALYIVIIATALIGVTNYNVQPWSWPRLRMATWFKYRVWETKAATPKEPAVMAADPVIPKLIMNGDPGLLQQARDEFGKQFVARTVFTSSPIPGVSIDVNDLGVLGGGALTLLMLVLLVCLMREHENLYLALYKVRQFARFRNHEHGSSEANLLYHALVMSQVLASPPTLARWRNRGTLRHFGLIYVLPLGVYLWVVRTNYGTLDVATEYVGATIANRYMDTQYVIAGILGILTVLSWLNSRAMSERWITAFRAINPVRERLPQMSVIEWLRVPMRHWFNQRFSQPGLSQLCHARTVTEIVDTLREKPNEVLKVTTGEVPLPVGNRISGRQLRKMTRSVCEKGLQRAKADMDGRGLEGEPELLSFTTKSNVIEGNTWKIDGEWRFEVRKKLYPEKYLPQRPRPYRS